MTVFADTSYFIALLMPRDQWRKSVERLHERRDSLVTSSQVIGETITLLQMRGYLSLALQFLAEVRADSELKIVYPDAAMQAAGWEEFRRHGGQGAGAVDSVSFAIMRKLGITRAYTFDRHFETAGFATLLP